MIHIDALDSYQARESIVHHLDARVKLILVVLFILAVSVMPDGAWLGYGLLEGLVLGVIVSSRVGWCTIQRRAALALPFALAAITVAFSTPGRPVWSLSVLGQHLALTDAGLVRFASIVVKSWLSVQMAVVLTASTPFPALLQGMRSLRIPKVLVAITGFAYRYIFVIGDEVLHMLRARAARSGSPDRRGGGRLMWRARVAGGMAGSLFLRSIERSERIYDAMVARGYDGEVRTLDAPRLRVKDVGLALAFIVAIALVQLAARMG